ncbi:hypothetical protein A8924_2032 [Saccharopolyspora erythraea NRRL 2338]|uniref:Uncharacterized protein n=2 Tax=Saccharopolyspora erythraea TaxID=1836 RepID=A4FA72_SACEN|nr:hypothetical protein [Saccharopolyspora erythraea]EQD83421.1 hypothetical protein N599_25440 [Saccharopolyspora erythraea D]PFG94733.1 hypothetical protein A8924_2032 [Saccharopolyspora erythraea NRRL 2338]QRK91455.1 hypothetical protein JQX30_08720 [Saccharopolyspora erythraea]CAM00947.1 hypothetical protein SACE_1628 [Saccharopolyspora erythraea NRRL 2338]
MSDSWSVRVRWLPWRRLARLGIAGDRWPRMVEGPLSVLARTLWFVLLPPLLLACLLELLVLWALLPFVLVGRALGLGSWWVDLRNHGCRAGTFRVAGARSARSLRRALAAHLRRGGAPGDDGAARLVAAEGAEFASVEISARDWELVLRRLSPHARRRWFLWRRRLSIADSLDVLPGGLGDDPVSAIIAIPFVLLFVLCLGGAVLELVVQAAILPVVVLLRLVRALAWPIEVVHRGTVETRQQVHGFLPSVRARRQLAEGLRLNRRRPEQLRQLAPLR